MPMRDSRPPSEPSSQEESSAEELSKWNARKQPLQKDATSATKKQQQTRQASNTAAIQSSALESEPALSADECLGFGNETVPKDAKTLPTKPTKGNSDRANASAGASNQADENTAADGRATTSKTSSKAASELRTAQRTSSVDRKQKHESTKAVAKKATPPDLGSSVLKAHASAGASGKQSVDASAGPKSKRPVADDPHAHERRVSLPKIPKITSLASPQSPDREPSSDDGVIASKEERPPKWYKAEPMPSTRNRNDSNVSTLLQRLSDQIKKHSVELVREILHQLAFEKVNRSLLKGSRMLHNEQGLSQIFDAEAPGGRPWPYDISADAKELYNRWCREIFETDLLRGIQLRSKASRAEGDRSTDRIIPGYAGKVDFHAFGNNDLSNGQWFPTQLATVRDGCHGKSQAGISGKAGEGAYSCIMTGQSGYPDEDRGDEVLYCGTDSETGTVTKDTQLLLDSANHGHPVRFIRKSTLKSPWAPEVGYRYDGLYDVKGFETLNVPGNHNAARHRFLLVRCAGQDPIRGMGPESRPTIQEIERFQMDKRFR